LIIIIIIFLTTALTPLYTDVLTHPFSLFIELSVQFSFSLPMPGIFHAIAVGKAHRQKRWALTI